MHNFMKGALLILLANTIITSPFPCYMFIGEYDFPVE